MEKALLELIELAKSAAPELWKIAMHQVYARVAVFVFLLVVSVGMIVFVFKLYPKYRMERNEDGEFLCYVFGTVGSVGVVLFPITLILYLMNPQYYAIQILLGLAGL